MKKAILVLLLLGINLKYTVAQLQATYTVGPVLELAQSANKSEELDLIGHDQSGIYVLKIRTQSLSRGGRMTIGATIEGFSSSTLKKTFSTPVDVPVKDGDEFTIRRVKLLNDKIRLFYSYFDKKEDLNRVSVFEVDLAGRVVTKQKELMAGPKEVHVYADTSGEKYLLLTSPPDNAKNSVVEATILDSDLKKIYTKTLVLSEYKDFERLDTKIDGSGNIYFAALVLGKGSLGLNPGLVMSTYNKSLDKLMHYAIYKHDDKAQGLINDRWSIKNKILFCSNKNSLCFIYYAPSGFNIARMNTSDATLDTSVFVRHKSGPEDPSGKKSKEKKLEFDHSGLFSAELNDNGTLNVCTQYNWVTGKGNWISEVIFSNALEISSQKYILLNALHEGSNNGALILHRKNSSIVFYNDELDNEGRGIRSSAYFNLAIATLSDANNGKPEKQKVTLKAPEGSRDMVIQTRKGQKMKGESGFITFVLFGSDYHLLKAQMND